MDFCSTDFRGADFSPWLRSSFQHRGTPLPLGVSFTGDLTNFSLVSTQATTVELCLFDREGGHLITAISLSPITNKTGNVWHIALQNLDSHLLYAYRITSKTHSDFLLDPYAVGTATGITWGKNHQFPAIKNQGYLPLGELPSPTASQFDWKDDSPPNIPINQLVIYEMHVRAFTQDPSSKVTHPGKFLGIIEKIPHLLDLGINAIELLPIQEFNELEYLQSHPEMKLPLYNFWGYSTVNFFAPMNRYASSAEKGATINEFKMMVQALHQHGIEVILDVVFNHTAEGGQSGPMLSFKGIDKEIYYMLDPQENYYNFSGCGNTFNVNQPVTQQLIIDCLRYWVTEMHVDGFRFDLASALMRGTNGAPLNSSPLIEAITHDPILASVKLISEPWDAAGLYHVGNFAPETNRWSEWNGKYRDCVRRFIKGTPQTLGEFAMRISGSQDLYGNRTSCNSLNFITCHDGFTLADLVSYNKKHNLANGEHNRDGTNDNESWNCGVEGPTINAKILHLREKQMRNFHLALMISQGVPMVHMGDEYGHTKHGNNNTWCQDNLLNWFLWDQLRQNSAFYRFYKGLIHFRKHHPILQRILFLTDQDIDWHGIDGSKPNWQSATLFIGFTLKDLNHGHHLYIAFNSQNIPLRVKIPRPSGAMQWHWVANTANHSPSDFYESNEGPLFLEDHFLMESHSAILLEQR